MRGETPANRTTCDRFICSEEAIQPKLKTSNCSACSLLHAEKMNSTGNLSPPDKHYNPEVALDSCSEKNILKIRAFAPFNTWQDDFSISAAFYGAEAKLISYFTTDDPVADDTINTESSDKLLENLRTRIISVNLDLLTNEIVPKVEIVVFGIGVSPSTTIWDFSRKGYGVAEISLDETVIFDFPIAYRQGSSNFYVLGSLIHNGKIAKPTAPNQIWNLKFSNVTGNSNNALAAIASEYRSALATQKIDAGTGTLNLEKLLIKKQSTVVSEFNRPDSKYNFETDIQEAGILPFDRVHNEVSGLWQKVQMNDQNMLDIWRYTAALKSEIQIMDTQYSIVSQLTDRMETLEHVFLDLYFGSTSTLRRMQDFIELNKQTVMSDEALALIEAKKKDAMESELRQRVLEYLSPSRPEDSRIANRYQPTHGRKYTSG